MLYGHDHATKEYEYLKKLRAELRSAWQQQGDPRSNFVNVGCMMPRMNYTPRTLEKIINTAQE